MVFARMSVPAALVPTGMSVSYPKARLDGHALGHVPRERWKTHLIAPKAVVIGCPFSVTAAWSVEWTATTISGCRCRSRGGCMGS